MKTKLLLIISIFSFLVSCEKEPSNLQSSSIIGRVLDKASDKPLVSATLILENGKSSYISSTDANGYFEFKDIIPGEYSLISKKNTESSINKSAQLVLNSEITDTLGLFSTDQPNWGDIYSQTFCSITGNIKLSSTNDYSEIIVRLLGTDKTALTTNKGFFRFDFLFPGLYDLKIEKELFRDLKIIDLNIPKGETFAIDTTLAPVYKLIKIKQDVIKWETRPVQDFAYCNGKFWFCKGGEGLFSYDPESKTEKVEMWDNLGLDGPYGLAGIADITNTYNNSFWLCGDAAIGQTLKKISLNPTRVELSRAPCGSLYGYGWDIETKSLVSGSYRYNRISILNTIDQTIKTVDVDLNISYDKTEYKNSFVWNIFIMPNQEAYLTIEKIDFLDRSEVFIYKYNNIHDLILLDTYKFPKDYEMKWYRRFSYYEGNIFINGDQIILE